MIDSSQTVAQLVLDHSALAPVFQRHRIDFCCKGEMTLREACEQRGVDEAALRADLERALAERSGAADVDPRTLGTPALAAHIVSKHHAYLRRVLPFARTLAAKVGRVHGEKDPRLQELAGVVAELEDQLVPHLDDEEEVLFPALSSREPDEALIERELSAMREEHESVGKLLERMRELTDSFNSPSWACNSYRTLMSELEQIEGDTLTHVHIENHVLMPRFQGARP
ncbi:MAG TPA: iron-sulfur cluster repair di-iron protein [Vulgatibacter sp.]|nr:iron-sulfur cluster repair di-iron protein [Vulgatibacter sp.]